MTRSEIPRTRGYYYDTETQLYYLQSRYYNPSTGRFINADGYVNANGDLIGYNMYAYCSNNPVMHVDPTGEIIEWIALGLLIVGMGELLTSCGFPAGSSTEYVEVEEALYSTVEDAVFAFGNAYLDTSIAENREYGAFIYEVTQNGKSYYTYSIVAIGTVDSTHQQLPNSVKDSQVRALVHTHGDYMENYRNGFSEADKKMQQNGE